MTQKSKALHSIVIDGCMIHTYLSYNLNTNHIGIGTSHQFINYNRNKQYKIDNKEYLKSQGKQYLKQYYKNNKNILKEKQQLIREKNSNYTKLGSLEHRIKRSCIIQKIPIKNFDGFLTDQKYCKLFSEKFREIIRYRFHNKCYLCDKVQNRKLSVHHVNYNKNCLCGSTCEFVPLCISCHSKTNQNRQYWEDLIMNYLYPNRYFMTDI